MVTTTDPLKNKHVGLAIVVPSDHLNHLRDVLHRDELLEASREEVIVRAVDAGRVSAAGTLRRLFARLTSCCRT